jgi:integrase
MTPRHLPITFSTPEFEQLEAARFQYKHASLAPRTVASYASDWRVFEAWCLAAGRVSLPATPDTVELYITDIIGRGRKVTSAERHVIAIAHRHREAGHSTPCSAAVGAVLSGARRLLCQKPSQKDALRLEDLQAMVMAIGSDTPIRARNSAMLLFGFATALRRANLASLRREHLTFTADGILVWVVGEKQDRKGDGREIAIPLGEHEATCPVRAVRRWLDCCAPGPGPLFCRVMRGHPNGKPLLGNRIAQIVQDAAAGIGLDRRRYGAHSLRAGLTTEGLNRGVAEITLARHTGHRSLDTLRIYARSRDPFRRSAAGMVGL